MSNNSALPFKMVHYGMPIVKRLSLLQNITLIQATESSLSWRRAGPFHLADFKEREKSATEELHNTETI